MIPTGIIVGIIKDSGAVVLCVAWPPQARREEAEAVGTKGRTVEDKPLGLEGMIGPPARHAAIILALGTHYGAI